LAALRIRGYRSSNPERRITDSIVVLSTQDASQRITLARGDPNDGMAWSPDGEWLAYVLDDALAVTDWQGSSPSTLASGGSAPRYPVWVSGDGILFTVGSNDAPQLMRIAVR
jgi:Tol biopolymer transport system component